MTGGGRMNALSKYAALIRVHTRTIDFGFKRETPKTVYGLRNLP
jgi:hypothetical protein